MGRAPTGTALLQPTLRMDPPQSKPSSSRSASSASFRFMNDTNPLKPLVLLRREAMSFPGPWEASLLGHMIFTYMRWLTLLDVCRKEKADRSNRTYAGEEVAEGLFCHMRREVGNENVGSLVCGAVLINAL